MIAFTICLWAIYLFHYRPQFRYFAYLLFSLSIQLKVYPVVFAVMFIQDWRDWKNNLKRLLGLGALNFSLLFVLGHSFYRDFIRAITAYQFAYQSSRYENLSIKGFTYYLSTSLLGLEITSKISALLEIFLLTSVGLLLFALLFLAWRRQWHGLNPSLLLGCTLVALVLPSVSNDYKLSLLIAPMILFLSCLPEVKGKNKQIMYILLLVLISLAYWSVFYPATVKPDFLDRNFPALFSMLILVTVLNFFVPYTDDNPSNSIL